MKSPKTTALGVISILIALLSGAKAFLDGDPTTNIDFGAITSAITAGVGLIFARDVNVTSEQAGAK